MAKEPGVRLRAMAIAADPRAEKKYTLKINRFERFETHDDDIAPDGYHRLSLREALHLIIAIRARQIKTKQTVIIPLALPEGEKKFVLLVSRGGRVKKQIHTIDAGSYYVYYAREE